MDSAALIAQSILVLEDEPLIALDICEALKGAGASVFVANCLRDALALADHPDLSAAILDFGRGYENAAARGATLRKPATRAALVETLARLLHSRAPAAQELARRA